MADATKPIVAANEYLYSTARIRAMETRLCSTARLERLIDTRSPEELLSNLGENGLRVVPKKDSSAPDVEESLITLLKDTYDEVEGMIPYPALVRFLRYPYDCHNLKAIIKCFFRNIEPEGMLFSCGSVPVEQLLPLVSAICGKDEKERRALDVYPPHMAHAACTAAEQYAQTKNPRIIDLLLDRACFEDMLESAQNTHCPFAEALVRTRIDVTNILITFRTLRMHSARAKELWEEAFLPGGTLDKNRLWQEDGDEEKLKAYLSLTAYQAFCKDSTGEGNSLAALEKTADNVLLAQTRHIKYVAFGAEVPLAYLVALEQDVKNYRILLAGRAAGLSSGEIRERMRESYV